MRELQMQSNLNVLLATHISTLVLSLVTWFCERLSSSWSSSKQNKERKIKLNLLIWVHLPESLDLMCELMNWKWLQQFASLVKKTQTQWWSIFDEMEMTECPWYNVEKKNPKVYGDGNVGVILSFILYTHPQTTNPYSKALKNTLVGLPWWCSG